MHSNGPGHVSPVSASAPWPPVWIGGEVNVDSTGDTTEPAESLTGPCPTCACAIGWRLPDGQVLCGECHDRHEFLVDAVKVVFVDDGRGWIDYASERELHERRHESLDEQDTWDDCEFWADASPACRACGRASGWESIAGTWHCLTCEPPRTSRRIELRASQIRRRPASLAAR